MISLNNILITPRPVRINLVTDVLVSAGAVVSNGLSASGHTQAAQDFVDDQEQRGGRAAPQHVRLRRRQRQVAVG